MLFLYLTLFNRFAFATFVLMSELLTTDAKALQLLFNEELYQIAPQAVVEVVSSVPISAPVEVPEFNYLGDNNRFFLLLVNEPGETHLEKSNLEVLQKILMAKGLELKDVAILNLSHHPEIGIETLKSYFSCSRLCLFDIAPAQLGLPELPSNEPGLFGELKVLATFSLKELQQTQHKKVAFWNAMKNF